MLVVFATMSVQNTHTHTQGAANLHNPKQIEGPSLSHD